MRVLKYLRGHIPAVALIVLLLVAQSFCELSLPAYTSRIVDTGIQSGGIEYAAPLALTDKTMDGVRLFLSDDDAAAVSAAYTDADGVWTINDTAQLPELEGIFIRPLVMYARLSEQGRTPCSPCASRCRAASSRTRRSSRAARKRSAAWARSPTASCTARPCSFSRRITPSRA